MHIKRKETKKRTIVKTLIMQIIVFGVLTTIVYTMDGTFIQGMSVALIDIFIESILYYIYERLWSNVEWGVVIKLPDDPDKTYNVINIPEPIEEDEKISV